MTSRDRIKTDKREQYDMMMNSRAFNQSLLYIALVTSMLLSACGGATSPQTEDGQSDLSGRQFVDGRVESADGFRSDTSIALPPQGSGVAGIVADGASPKAVSAGDWSAANPTAFLSKSDTRAMWLWNENPTAEEILNNTGGAQDELLAFAAAPHGKPDRAINRLFFEARGHSNANRFAKVRTPTYDPLTDPAEQEKLRSFLKRSHAQGMAVEYLDGQAIWVATDENAEAPKQLCRDVVAFNKSTDDANARFDGIHLDIEPHTVRKGPYAGVWWENRLPGGYNAEWTQRWKEILNSCRQTLDDYAAETGHRMTLASDLGTDYAHYNKPILEFLNRSGGPLDYLTIMNYYDNRSNVNGDPSYFYGDGAAGQVVGGVIENLAAWDQLPLIFAVETGPESIAVDEDSFFQEGYDAMYRTIDTLLSEYSSDRTIGVGIHHYSPQSYRDMKQ
jgi:hypothetical protein